MNSEIKAWAFIGLIAGLAMAWAMTASTGCSRLRVFDEATGTFHNDRENVAAWKVDDREEGIIKALETHGKVKVIRVKEANPIADWVLGGAMVLGGMCVAGGIVWVVYNIIYLGGKYIKSGIAAIVTGLILFGGAYFLMEYMWVLLTAIGIASLGGIAWIVWYLRDQASIVKAAIKTVDVAKVGSVDESTKAAMRNVQGKHQSFFKKMMDKVG